MPLRGLIFDFDGLIMDSESAAYAAWLAIYKEYGMVLQLERWVACVGTGDHAFDPVQHLAELLRLAGDERSLDGKALFAEKEQRKQLICDGLEPLAGVRELMQEARQKGLSLAVASSSSHAWVHGHLTRLNLRHYLQALRTRDDVKRVKPDPELFLSAAAALNLKPADCIVFEDSFNGLLAAKAAGMRCIAVPGPITAGLDFSLADARLSSLAEFKLGELV